MLLLADCVTGGGLHQPVLCEVSLGDDDKPVLVPVLHSSVEETGRVAGCGIYTDECSWLGHAGPEPSMFTGPKDHSPTRLGEGLLVAESRTFLPYCPHTASPQAPSFLPDEMGK